MKMNFESSKQLISIPFIQRINAWFTKLSKQNLNLKPLIRKKETNYDYLAPDTSEIRLLLTENDTHSVSLAHCTLPADCTSIACMHKSVEEIWYFLSGTGEVWLNNAEVEIIHLVTQNTVLTIPP